MINYSKFPPQIVFSIFPDMEHLKNNILKTLLYYDIFSHPLKSEEIFVFLHQNSVSKDDVFQVLRSSAREDSCRFGERDGYYYVKPNDINVSKRLHKEEYSQKMWRIAGFVTHVIKRFPFVRGVMITGSLSKNSSDHTSDLDFMVITKPGRLWITRTMLMLFKKIFLLNSYKYFCINFLITEDNLEIEDKNVFTATEVTTVKATYNSELMRRFIESNKWVNKYFPNYVLCEPMLHTAGCKVTNRRSALQFFTELIFIPPLADKLDEYLMLKMASYWKKKYSYMEEDERNFKLRSRRNVSKTHPDSVHRRVLESYNDKLKQFNLE